MQPCGRWSSVTHACQHLAAIAPCLPSLVSPPCCPPAPPPPPPHTQEMEKEVEEAAWSLGASPWQTFTQVRRHVQHSTHLAPSPAAGTSCAAARTNQLICCCCTAVPQVLLPPLLPPLLTGTALAFSRALGEFGSVVIVSSNFPYKDLIAPVLIFQCLEQYDFVGATVIGTVLLLISLVMMVGVNWLQSYSQRFRK